VAPNSSLPMVDSTDEVDKQQCRVTGKIAVQSVLTGVVR
jgi:hypothetical protein